MASHIEETIDGVESVRCRRPNPTDRTCLSVDLEPQGLRSRATDAVPGRAADAATIGVLARMSAGVPVDDYSREILHDLRRRCIPWPQWDDAASEIASWLNKRQTGILRSEDEAFGVTDSVVEAFRATGIGSFGTLLGSTEVAETVQFFKQQTGYSAHHVSSSDRRPVKFDELAARHRYCSYDPNTVLRAPHLAALANRPEILDFVERALGCVPTLYSVNAWWSFVVDDPPWPPFAQHFHRDDDDFRFFTLFAYLTDVSSLADGPNQVLPWSQTLEGLGSLLEEARTAGRLSGDDSASVEFFSSRYPNPNERVDQVFGPRIVSTLGPAGTCFLADTRALHRGLKPTTRPRLMFWARYGLGPNSNSSDLDLKNGPVPVARLGASILDSARSRYINRLLVGF